MYNNYEIQVEGDQIVIDAIAAIEATEGVANGIATLDVNGKLDADQVPALSLSQTFTASSEAIQLSLPIAPDTRAVNIGDICVRSDENKTYVCIKDYDGSQSAGTFDTYWQELLTPTDLVLSVAGKIGNVTLVAADLTDLTATAEELNYCDGVAANIQTQLNTKISNVVADSTPQLGGDLDLNGFNIITTANGNIVLYPNGTGITVVKSNTSQFGDGNNINDIYLIADTGEANLPRIRYKVDTNKWQFSNDGSVFIDMASKVEDDTTPTLGGNLDMSVYNVGYLTKDDTYYLHNKIYTSDVIGVKWAYTVTNPVLTMINEFDETITTDSTLFANHPIYSKMRRCNVADDGAINAWYGDTAFDYAGGNGQVMVYIPAFWYRSYKDDDYIRYFISATPRSGFKRHHAFISDSADKDYFMWGTFEACAYDTSATAYNTTDAAGVDFTPTTGDVLSSIAGVKPISGENNTLTRANARILAENRGTGWQLIDFNQVSALQLLFMVRYGTLNSQSIFEGVTDLATETGNESINTGYTAGVGVGSSDFGNASGEVSVLATQPFSFYGIENFYGNIWKWVDGINIKADYNPWIADHGYVDDTFTAPYVDTGLTLAAANGYVSAIEYDSENDYFFLASAVTGSSSTYLCDYYYQNVGNRVALFGSSWSRGATAGAVYWNLHHSVASSLRSIGSRIAYVPQ